MGGGFYEGEEDGGWGLLEFYIDYYILVYVSDCDLADIVINNQCAFSITNSLLLFVHQK